jgi:mono/diheme cytochrome c family protein
MRVGSVLRGCALAGLLCVMACGGAPGPDPMVPKNASSPSDAPAASSASGASLDGAALYAANCSSCHADSKKHTIAAEIHKAIDGNAGKMGRLSGLTTAQIDAIAMAP